MFALRNLSRDSRFKELIKAVAVVLMAYRAARQIWSQHSGQQRTWNNVEEEIQSHKNYIHTGIDRYIDTQIEIDK